MSDLVEIADANLRRAREIIEETDVVGVWERHGARARLVGSVRTGLLMDKRDIDFHVYSDEFSIAESFAAVAELAANGRVRRVEYANLLDTDEACLEWHAWYEDGEGELWQIDMIHILKGSRYDGHFEEVADRIRAALAPQAREAVLGIKHGLGPEPGVMSIEIYMAVLRDGVRTLDEFRQWRAGRPQAGIVDWMP